MKLVYQYLVIFCNFETTSNHLHPLQVENCDSNSRLVVGKNDNDKFRLERVNPLIYSLFYFVLAKLVKTIFFHSQEGVNRISETQLQVSGNSN